MPNLESRWESLCNQLEIVVDDGLFRELVTRYIEPHRAYHTLAHIEAMLCEFDQVRSFTNNPNAVELAIWYHDVVYWPKRKDNEVESAVLFASTKLKFEIPSSLLVKVIGMIQATDHLQTRNTHDGEILCDIDLSILGQSEETFDEYERQIRKEYDWVPEEAFIKGRSAILQSFLDRTHIYSTEFFQRKYEEQARKNLARSIEQLSRRLQP